MQNTAYMMHHPVGAIHLYFMALICVANDGPVSSRGGSGLSSTRDSVMMVPLPSGACETFR